jgi:putative component of membrane protein insertase Oxa1/YidC/SpoIIIJ protein YidD
MQRSPLGQTHHLDQVFLWLLAFYQVFISPYKGFKCAHGVLHGQGTCSSLAKQMIVQNGIIAAWPKIRQQLHGCGQSYQVLQMLAMHAQSPAQLSDAIMLWRKRDEPERQSWVNQYADSFGDLAASCGCDHLTGLGCDACDCSAV